MHTKSRPMSENTINAALRRMGYSGDEMTAHGLRATASTLLNESGLWSHDAIERAGALHIRGNHADVAARLEAVLTARDVERPRPAEADLIRRHRRPRVVVHGRERREIEQGTVQQEMWQELNVF